MVRGEGGAHVILTNAVAPATSPLAGDGKDGRQPFHVVVFSCAVRAVCEFTVRKALTACAVGGAVLYAPIGKRSRCEFVLIGRCLACDHDALEVGVLLYMNMEAVSPCVDACLSCGALPCGVDPPFAVGGADVGVVGIDLPAAHGCADAKSRRGVLLSVVVFFLQALDVEVAADSHLNMLPLLLGTATDQARVSGRSYSLRCIVTSGSYSDIISMNSSAAMIT